MLRRAYSGFTVVPATQAGEKLPTLTILHDDIDVLIIFQRLFQLCNTEHPLQLLQHLDLHANVGRVTRDPCDVLQLLSSYRKAFALKELAAG